MKKLVFVLGTMVLLCGNVWAQENWDKTIVDQKIVELYGHPEYWDGVEDQCKWPLSLLKQKKYPTNDQEYHKAILCLTWEVNKKINKQQVYDLMHLKSLFIDVISQSFVDTKVDVPSSMYSGYQYSLELLLHLYSTIYKQNIYDCSANETNEFGFKETTNLCENDSKNFTSCHNEIICMQNKIIEIFNTPNKYKHEKRNIKNLLSITENFVNSIFSNGQEVEYENIFLLKFYNSVFTKINRDIAYIEEHD